MPSNYSHGAAFERKTRHHLEENGYEVIRSAGSKGKVDLVAFKRGQILFVQNKLNGLCAPAERSRLRDLAGMVGALPIVAYRHKDGRAAAVVRYRLLTGDGPKAFSAWTPDEVAWPKLEPLAEFSYRPTLGQQLDAAQPGTPVTVRSVDDEADWCATW